MRKLSVRFQGWGEDWVLGTLAELDRSIYFEYSEEALARGIELSPYKAKLAPGVRKDFPNFFDHLPGFIADALPDGWGRLLMDRAFERSGRDRATVSPLERLAFIGDGAMGALAFEPASAYRLERSDLSLLQIARAAKKVLEGKDTDVLGSLLALGGSPQGARPKALIQFDVASRRVSTHEAAAGEPWLVKFPAREEGKEVCAIEHAYARAAGACGIEMPPSEVFDLSTAHAAFGVRRFDRVEGKRVPILSAAAALHADFRLPQVGYQQLLQVISFVTGDRRQLLKAFERCVFNVVFNNRDDHVKNFAFRMNAGMKWELSPAFDITYSFGPRGEHQCDVMGNGRDPGLNELLALARAVGIPEVEARASIERICDGSDLLAGFFKDLDLSKVLTRPILKAISINAARCNVKPAAPPSPAPRAPSRRP
jgi:serine/threonine-protein kinase HipA